MSETTIYKEGFNAGFMRLRQIDVEAATKELWQALGINNRNTFAAYKFGRIEPKASQAVAVELVFRKYGVTTNIWGNRNESRSRTNAARNPNSRIIGLGSRKKEVADRLSISPRTVENTARNIYSKIGIQKATGAFAYGGSAHIAAFPSTYPL